MRDTRDSPSDAISVLVVDDTRADRELVAALLDQVSTQRYAVVGAASIDEASRALDDETFDVCLVDYRLGADSGLDLIADCVARGSRCPFLLLTGQGSRDVDLEAARAGATGYLAKDELSPESLERAVRYAIEGLRYRAEQQRDALLQTLQRLAQSHPVPFHSGDGRRLREVSPDAFDNFVACYDHLLDLALDQRAYKVEHDVSEGLEAMAEQLGAFFASPRDVIEIHYRSARNKTTGVPHERALSYVEEGNLLALELMGHLASYYRRFAAPDGEQRRRNQPQATAAGGGS